MAGLTEPQPQLTQAMPLAAATRGPKFGTWALRYLLPARFARPPGVRPNSLANALINADGLA